MVLQPPISCEISIACDDRSTFLLLFVMLYKDKKTWSRKSIQICAGSLLVARTARSPYTGQIASFFFHRLLVSYLITAVFGT